MRHVGDRVFAANFRHDGIRHEREIDQITDASASMLPVIRSAFMSGSCVLVGGIAAAELHDGEQGDVGVQTG